MRITAGKYRNRRLIVPKSGLRPTMDQVRLALFNILGSVEGASFLDLCAGSGAVGIEALSRGALSCVFVESDPQSCRVIRQNLASLGLSALVVQDRAEHFIRSCGKFDYAFLDPPYSGAMGQAGLLAAGRFVEKKLICEMDARLDPPLIDGLCLESKRVYGETALVFYAPAI
jgi:16S rRNA (guanine966-N2)-methyltransferase